MLTLRKVIGNAQFPVAPWPGAAEISKSEGEQDEAVTFKLAVVVVVTSPSAAEVEVVEKAEEVAGDPALGLPPEQPQIQTAIPTASAKADRPAPRAI